MSKERSPFSPGQPVAPEFFVGRESQVKLLRRAIRQAASGSPQYVFITGQRGIGKSSLACLAAELAEKEYGFVSAQALLGGSESLGEVCRRLYESLVSQLPEKGLVDKAVQVFQEYVASVDLFGLGVKLRRDNRSRRGLAENFLPLLERIRQIIVQGGKKGMVLIADDLNGIARVGRFGSFLKSTVDQIAVTRMRRFPWVLVLVGVPERMDDLKAQQPSVGRIFHPIDLELMDETDAREFFERTFDSVQHSYDPGALSVMANSVGGFPVLWHEVGDATFWEDEDQHIGLDDARAGVTAAAQNVGRKYLKRPLYDELRSAVYRNILGYVSRLKAFGGDIERRQALKELPAREAKNFDKFVRKMRDLDVLRRVPGHRGVYRFANQLYQYYVVIQSNTFVAQLGRDAGRSPTRRKR